MRKKRKVLRPVWPNAGLEAEYRRRLRYLLNEIHDSVLYWVRAAYRNNEPEVAYVAAKFGQDASPYQELRKAIKKLSKRWLDSIESTAPNLAKWFAKSASQRSDKTLAKYLKAGGFAVEFRLTAAQRDALGAIIQENVSLIKSIPQQYLQKVEQLVMHSVSQGRDLEYLTKEIEKRYHVGRKRAILISRDQNNKATSALQRVRRMELGLNKAIWLHSHAGKQPRPAHVKMHGREFDIARGMWDPHEQMHIQPGFLINCFPADEKVHLGTGVRRVWRTPFKGPMVHLRVGADLLKGTFNHPVLTTRGWVPLGLLNDTDKVVCMSSDCGGMIDNHKNGEVTTFGQLFEACSVVGTNVRRQRTCFDFHGDLPNGEVDEVVVINDDLPFNREPMRFKEFEQSLLTKANSLIGVSVFGSVDEILRSCGARFANALFVLLWGLTSRHNLVGFSAGTELSSFFSENPVNDSARSTKFLSKNIWAKTLDVELDDLFARHWTFETTARPVPGSNPNSLESFTEFIRGAANTSCDVFDFGSIKYEFRSISDKFIQNFSGHVFTLQSHTGYYSVGDALMQAKNCRCTSKAVIPGLT